ncbi:inorganic phosphate transporter [Paracoccus jiaweipingae]|uniref:inorganic phosphate transporter n=1 Tax=unclassified Paracoccus (in: a-proteobacteria) TaxID=2688777 RepID=UPI0037B3474C
MAKNPQDYRILDKDLGRIANAETAAAQAASGWLRLGAAALFIAAVVLVVLGMAGQQGALATIAAGAAIAAYLALGIGGNDVSNALAPAYGARAISLGAGLALAAGAELAGAWLGGQAVTGTLTRGILNIDLLLFDRAPARIMLAALLAAAIWISLATWSRAPVSTTHSIVGGIAGAGIAAQGLAAVEWRMLAQIGLVWVVSPLVSGLLAGGLLAFLRFRVDRAGDRRRAAAVWLPAMVAVTAGAFALYVGTLAGQGGAVLATTAPAVALLGWLWARRTLLRQMALLQPEKSVLKHLLGPPLVLSAGLMAFAHGANDVANVAAPLTVLLQSAGLRGAAIATPQWIIGLASLGVATGIVLFGRRLVQMVGSGITRLNPVRALCVTMATAITVIAASALAFPVSTTHIAVGGVFGVGLFREWDDRRRRKTRAALPDEELHRRHLVRRSYMGAIVTAWAVTVPISAGLAGGILLIIRRLV